MTHIAIRDASVADFPAIVRLNEREVQHTSPMDVERLVHLNSIACYHRVVTAGDEVAAFLLAMRDHCGYVNPNFEWFAARYPEFMYVDRIVVCADRHRLGLGSRLYRDLFRRARDSRIPVVTCEYNVVPPNEASCRFHDTAGFREVGTQWLAGGLKRVSLQAAPTGVTSE